MGIFADSWLVEVDRQAWQPYFAGLGLGVVATPELGEAWRRVTWLKAVDSETVTASGLTRFAMPIEWEGSEGEFVARGESGPVRIRALRRHDRFVVQRLLRCHSEAQSRRILAPLQVAVSNGRVYTGRIPDAASGFLPEQAAQDATLPSRAGEKVSEALAWLALRGLAPVERGHWLELGAFPGGMTTVLSRRGYRVTAVDVHPPSAAMTSLPGVACWTRPAEDHVQVEAVDALLCDVNGSPGRAAATAAHFVPALRPGGLVIHTVKLPDWSAAAASVRDARSRFTTAGLEVLAVRHLRQNRQELTLFARRPEGGEGVNLRDR